MITKLYYDVDDIAQTGDPLVDVEVTYIHLSIHFSSIFLSIYLQYIKVAGSSEVLVPAGVILESDDEIDLIHPIVFHLLK